MPDTELRAAVLRMNEYARDRRWGGQLYEDWELIVIALQVNLDERKPEVIKPLTWLGTRASAELLIAQMDIIDTNRVESVFSTQNIHKRHLGKTTYDIETDEFQPIGESPKSNSTLYLDTLTGHVTMRSGDTLERIDGGWRVVA